MALKYFKNAAGDYIKLGEAGSLGDYMKDEACCCDTGPGPCCSEPGGPPTAAGSVEYLDDNPCRYQLNDESVAGTCGSIVSWLWELPSSSTFDGGGTTSTLQTPPPFEYSGLGSTTIYYVTLTVVDAEGCEDTVLIPFTCFGSTCMDALCNDAPVPAFVTVTVSGFTGTAAAEVNGTHTLLYQGLGCEYRKAFSNAACGVSLTMIVRFGSTVRIQFTTVGGFGVLPDYEDAAVATPRTCRGSFTLPRTVSGTHACLSGGDATALVVL